MLKKIDNGITPFANLHDVFRMSEEELENKRVRLFPNGQTDKETATASIFLASFAAVKEYRELLLTEIGIKKIKNQNIKLHIYTEIANANNEGKERLDGLIVVTSGKATPIIERAIFVECKNGRDTQDQYQITRYIDFAKDIGINDLITISNELVTSPLDSPVKSHKKAFNLYHWSWTYLKVMAKHLLLTNAVKDEDHIFILKELRRYFDANKNINNKINMGSHWKETVNKINSLQPTEKINKEILNSLINQYIQEEKDVSLQLTDRTEYCINLLTNGCRKDAMTKMMQSKKRIDTTFIIDKNKKHTFHIEVDFIRRSIHCYMRFEISSGKSRSQTSSLIKKLQPTSGTTDKIIINAYYIRNKSNKKNICLEQLIKEKELNDPYSILDKSYGDVVKHFIIEMMDDINSSDFISPTKFITKLETIAERFVTQVVASFY